MVQLKDDCFTAGDGLMPLAEGIALLADRLSPVTGIETVAIREAQGRVLAADVVAGRDVPPHDNSAVDGFAVFFDDLDGGGETRLRVTGRSAAGHPMGAPARRREAVRIFTGAPMPEGADTVFMQEDCRIDGDHVILPPGIKRGANRRFKGEDVKKGSTIIKRGKLLRPQEVGLAASVGCSELTVYQRLGVAVFSTGDEVFDPTDGTTGGGAAEGGIFDANRYTVMGLLEGLGCAVSDIGILPDDEAAIGKALAPAAAAHDLLVTSGGVSVGEEDHVKAAVEALGQLHFWRLAIKPGRPIALGRVGETTFVGLPGNPVAAMVTFMRIARPVVLLLSGRTDIEPPLYRLRADFAHNKKIGRREWLRARLVRDGRGELAAVKYPGGGSGILSSMVEADGLVELGEEQGSVNKGEMVDFLPFSEVSS
ncbi:MAG: molybdopterin molybdotransferase MoeA [Rhodospirillales bacterium]|jgi:molybdopterin molybdotransferase|nr:molybdopterin molybdotransferase MoeA [Rhodospirillales bacterium]HIJ44190.1 molybdopterin molybdotransferase MoeA [Rhodospirillaceae bacterium]MDP7098732.1 molybdopterin molybdotransferase MoeA [Rhodospirillales bacterium]MDP7214342.1 molybdopterin molybdotransferase MoeA [Rhodospirillales bacterium]HIJ46120.1 molybdopterin molybdotransferase MoeA [Rhodospirillaceae bacterium]